MTKITTANPSRLVVTIGLCFMVALMEGLDLQAAGIAAVGGGDRRRRHGAGLCAG